EGDLEAIGGAGALATIIEQTPSAANIEHYAELMKSKATLRRVIEVCSTTIEQAYDLGSDAIDPFLNEFEAQMFNVTEKARGAGLTPARDIIRASLDRIEQLYNQKASITGVASGFTDLDRMTSGFQPGDLI